MHTYPDVPGGVERRDGGGRGGGGQSPSEARVQGQGWPVHSSSGCSYVSDTVDGRLGPED